ncbi:MAG: T9SS type A sorting domain-containing protein [Fibrobacteres bacterium]|nr:T9SS type A sorting domain-containing protein [Fibrobacterota bacterium]
MKILTLLVTALSLYALNVPLEVSNWSDIAKTGEPVSAGVPLPIGSVSDLSKLRITNSSGVTVPAQFHPLSRWWRERAAGKSNPSVKWVLCDFQADVPASGKTAFFLKDDNTAPPTTQLTLTEETSKITVVTGPLKFTVSKTAFNLFDEVWLDANNNTTFESTEKVIASSSENGGFIKAGDWSAEQCTTGAVHSSTVKPVDRIIVEEKGPMKVVIRVEGRHFKTVGGVSRGLYGYQVFITAYAGKKDVDVQWAVTNLYMEGTKPAQTGTADPYKVYVWPFSEYTLNVNLNLNASSQNYSLLGASEVNGTLSATPIKLLQKSGSYSVNGAPGGTESKGAAAITDGTLGVMVAHRDFGPNNPKAISVSANKLSLELFPDTGAGVKYWLDPYTRKNHRLRFSFFSGSYSAGSLAVLAKNVDAPLRMLAPREWYQSTAAWYRGYGVPPNSELNRKASSAWTRMSKSSSNLVKNVADNNQLPNNWSTAFQLGGFNSGGDHWNLTSCFWQYLNTGNPADFEYPEAVAHNCNDMVPVQFSWYDDPWVKLDWFLNAEQHLTGLTSYHGPTNNIIYNGTYVTFPGWAYHRSDIPDNGHMTNLQMIEYYQLTGDLATKDFILALGVRADAAMMGNTYFTGNPGWRPRTPAVNDSIYMFGGQQRYIARPGIVMSHAYDVSGDVRFLRGMQLSAYSMRNFVRRNPSGFMAEAGNRSYLYAYNDAGLLANWKTRHPSDTAVPVSCHSNDFMEGIALEWLYDYYDKTGDAEIRDAIIMSVKSMEQRAGHDGTKYTGFNYGGYGDYLYEGRRYNLCAELSAPIFNVSMAEAFGGFIFGYLVSGRQDFWRVIVDGNNTYNNSHTGEMKAINVWQAKYKHDSLDIIPPAKVTDLQAVAVAGTGVQLSWTAPGNNGMTGKAASYRVKVARAPIVDTVARWNSTTQTGWPDMTAPLPYTVSALIAKQDNYKLTKEISFWAAQAASGAPVPVNGGSAQTMVITGLDTAYTYHIALVAFDSAGNVSEISNVVTSKGTAVEKASGKETLLALYPPKPNPFNPSTAIRFTLPENKQVSLAVYDIHGRLVKSVVDGYLEKGAHQAFWDGTDNSRLNVSSGIYVFRLTVDGKVLNRKMALSR